MAYLPEPQAQAAPLCPTGLTWEGQARMAYVRRAAGLLCTDVDKEAMRRVPREEAAW